MKVGYPDSWEIWLDRAQILSPEEGGAFFSNVIAIFSREIRQYFSKADVHTPDKLRVNRVLQTIPLFYETSDIQEGDGMWTEPENRVSI